MGRKIFTLILMLILIVLKLHSVYGMPSMFADINDFDVPEYLKPYVDHVTYSNRDTTFERNGILYKVLADSLPNGNTTLYDRNISRNIMLHEIGHLVYWDVYGKDAEGNSEELANLFVIKVKETSSLKELLISMGYLKCHFRFTVDYQAQINSATASGAGSSIIDYLDTQRTAKIYHMTHKWVGIR